MNLPTSPSDILKSHFEKLKEVIPSMYEEVSGNESEEEKLFDLLKRSLTIVEAVYFQNREMFTLARMEEYGKIIEELAALGYDYHGNKELMEKAAAAAIMNAKLPMEKAKGKAVDSQSDPAKKAM
jgi:hypothetical protein